MLSKLVDYLRVRDWINGYLWNTIVVLLFLTIIGLNQSRIEAFLLFLIYQGLIVIYIGLTNSLADREPDLKAGKKPRIDLFPRKTTIGIIVLAIIGLLSVGIYGNTTTFIISLVILLLPILYSFKPIRLKERGFLGIVAAALLLGPLPFLLFASLTVINHLALFLALWMFSRQLLLDMFHQQLDYEVDKKTSTKTFAVSIGKTNTKNIILALFFAFALVTVWPAVFFGSTGLIMTAVLIVFTLQPLAHVFNV